MRHSHLSQQCQCWSIYLPKQQFTRPKYQFGQVKAVSMNFDSEKYYLGKLCPKGHHWEGTGQTLRRRKTSRCPKCECERVAKYRQADIERYRSQRRASYRRNKATKASYDSRYRMHNKTKIKSQWASWYQSNRERHIRHNAALRYRRQQIHSIPYTCTQLDERLAQFEGCCAYCGNQPKPLHWEHFIPLSRSGTDVIGNLLPACQACNSSKNAFDPYEWYRKQPFFSDERWLHILQVLGKTQRNYNQPPLR